MDIMLLFGKCVPFWGSMRWHFVNWPAVYHLKQYAHCTLVHCKHSCSGNKYKKSHFPALISRVDGRRDLRELYHNGTVVSWLKKREKDKYSWNIEFAGERWIFFPIEPRGFSYHRNANIYGRVTMIWPKYVRDRGGRDHLFPECEASNKIFTMQLK